ncbi:AAA family ATPase [Pseudohalioglobus lutimaris]|nr:AAA family ATPase [Pseudohalioglobus lutimaris]
MSANPDKSLDEKLFVFGEITDDQLAAAMGAGAIRQRKIPPEDYLFTNEQGGGIFSTVDFCQIVGGTGAGKTLFTIPLAVAVAAGRDFLGWKCTRARRVIYFDGELAEITIQERLELAVSQLTEVEQALVSKNLFVFNRESMLTDLGIELEPLDSVKGREQVEYLVDAFGAEAAMFDSRFCLLAADMKESGSMPTALILSLRSRKVFDMWLHHHGKDATKGGYGDKTAEFLMDTNIELSTIDGDHRLELKFQKKRKQKPISESLYADIAIEHSAGEWFKAGEVPKDRKGTATHSNESLVMKAMVALNIRRQDITDDLGMHYIPREAVREYLMDNGFFERTPTGVMEKPDRTAINKAIRNLLGEKLEGDSKQLRILKK